MKINVINKIIIGLTVLCLIGCAVHQTVSAPTAAAAADTVTFSGKVIADGGRSAGVDIDVTKLSWSVTAESKTSEAITGEVSENKSSWAITLPKDDGLWSISVKAKLNAVVIYEGTTDVTADQSADSRNVIVYFKSNLLNAAATGKVQLTFVDDSHSINKVIMKTVSSDPDTPTTIDASADFDQSHKAVLDTIMPTGQHTKTFDFCDAAGNTLYQCREIVTVFADCTTDTWFGTSSHLVKNETGSYEFKITNDLITHYGTETVPRTETVLYDNTYDEELQTYIFKYTIGDMSIKSDANIVNFCFDNTGDVYVLKSINETDNKSTIWSNKNGFGENSEKSVTIKLDGIAIDRKNGKLYGSATVENEEEMRLYDMDDMSEYRIACDYTSYFNTSIFTVNDNELFIPYCFVPNEDTIDIYIAKKSLLSAEECTDNVTSTQYKAVYIDDEFSDNEIINITPYDMTFTNSPIITDILYQDGCLYVLLKEYKTECNLNDGDDYLSSRGAVIKYDLFNQATMSIGWTSVSLLDDNDSIKFYESNNIDNEECIYLIENVSDYTLSLYAPSDNNEGLYGPNRFIGICPKKLVISDEGFAFYTDLHAACCISNVNRVVTIDLENFGMEMETAPVTFETDGLGSAYISLGYFESIGDSGVSLVIPVK